MKILGIKELLVLLITFIEYEYQQKGEKMEKKAKKAQEQCLTSAKIIINEKRENWFTPEEIQEDFKRREVKAPYSGGSEYSIGEIRGHLKGNYSRDGDIKDIFESIQKDGKEGYRIKMAEYLLLKVLNIQKAVKDIEKNLQAVKKDLEGLKNIKNIV
jgi:hypothetical protein